MTKLDAVVQFSGQMASADNLSFLMLLCMHTLVYKDKLLICKLELINKMFTFLIEVKNTKTII